MKIPHPNIIGAILFLLSTFVHGGHNLDFSDLEALGVSCPGPIGPEHTTGLRNRYKCNGNRSNLGISDRGCECDNACNDYKDCCINAPRMTSNSRTSQLRSRMTCLPSGENSDMGVYVIATCRNGWVGESEIRQKCEGPIDFSDPLNAAPVTSIARAVTYRNRYCAECNDANMVNLQTFQLLLSCEGLSARITQEQIYADLRYDEELAMWGIDRMNSFGNATKFFSCDIFFDAPDYLTHIVRFCRANIISRCPVGYTRHSIRRACDDYMAVVYDDHNAYRNPHCAICNNRTVEHISCKTGLIGRKRPMSFALLLDINQSDGDQVGMTRVTTPECPSNHKYDPFFKKCRRLVCALPGTVMVDGKCVRKP